MPHDHAHEYEHEHGHGHEHEHEHEHVHVHEHEHEHGHEHEHEHEHGVQITHHEEAVIISGSVNAAMPADDAVKLTGDRLSLIAQYVEDHGGVVGHVKAAVRATETCALSVTEAGRPTVVKHADLTDISVNAAAIVFGITDESAGEIAHMIEHLLTK